jgi:hypothetical protein
VLKVDGRVVVAAAALAIAVVLHQQEAVGPCFRHLVGSVTDVGPDVDGFGMDDAAGIARRVLVAMEQIIERALERPTPLVGGAGGDVVVDARDDHPG